MMREETISIYKFDELSSEAKQKAIDNNFGYNVDFGQWSECTIESLKDLAAELGIYIDKIYFSGFSSQGDGACFEGDYQYKKGALKLIKKEYPDFTALHDIAKQLQDIQKLNGYRLEASVKHSGRYMHENCTSINITTYALGDGYRTDSVNDNAIDTLTEVLKDFMRLIYKQLNDDYNYQTSDEEIKESLRANEAEFLASGENH